MNDFNELYLSRNLSHLFNWSFSNLCKQTSVKSSRPIKRRGGIFKHTRKHTHRWMKDRMIWMIMNDWTECHPNLWAEWIISTIDESKIEELIIQEHEWAGKQGGDLVVVQDKEAIGEGHGYGGFSPIYEILSQSSARITRTQMCRQITIRIVFLWNETCWHIITKLLSCQFGPALLLKECSWP